MVLLKALLLKLIYRLKSLFRRTASSQVGVQQLVAVQGGSSISMSLAAIICLVGVSVAPLYGCHVKKERDQWWVTELKAKRGVVLDVVSAGNIEVDAADKQAIAEQDKENANAKAEMVIRRALAGQPISPGCDQCRIPADRVRVQ